MLAKDSSPSPLPPASFHSGLPPEGSQCAVSQGQLCSSHSLAPVVSKPNPKSSVCSTRAHMVSSDCLPSFTFKSIPLPLGRRASSGPYSIWPQCLHQPQLFHVKCSSHVCSSCPDAGFPASSCQLMPFLPNGPIYQSLILSVQCPPPSGLPHFYSAFIRSYLTLWFLHISFLHSLGANWIGHLLLCLLSILPVLLFW